MTFTFGRTQKGAAESGRVVGADRRGRRGKPDRPPADRTLLSQNEGRRPSDQPRDARLSDATAPLPRRSESRPGPSLESSPSLVNPPESRGFARQCKSGRFSFSLGAVPIWFQPVKRRPRTTRWQLARRANRGTVRLLDMGIEPRVNPPFPKFLW